MKARFIGVPGEQHPGLTMYGTYYPLNKWMPVTDKTAKTKLGNHPHFEADAKDEDIEDAKIKGELEAALSPVLQAAEQEAEAHRQAETDQAARNAENERLQDQIREVQSIDTAEEFQRVTQTAPAVVAGPVEADTALEFQQATQYPSGAAYGNTERLGDSDAGETASAGAGRARKPGRPAKGN